MYRYGGSGGGGGRTARRRRTRGLGQKSFIRQLTRKYYPSCMHDDQTTREKNHDKYGAEHKITYGEMEYEGIDKLYAYVSSIRPIDTFIDIGSGRGKLCMYMASKPQIQRALGVELVESRHADAMFLKRQLKSDFADKVEFINSNIFNVDLSCYANSHIFIWFSNLCFEQSSTNKIFDKLKQELPVGTIVTCSNQINEEVRGFTLLDTRQIPMSWHRDSNVYVYTIDG
jgi:hypothetical protein